MRKVQALVVLAWALVLAGVGGAAAQLCNGAASCEECVRMQVEAECAWCAEVGCFYRPLGTCEASRTVTGMGSCPVPSSPDTFMAPGILAGILVGLVVLVSFGAVLFCLYHGRFRNCCKEETYPPEIYEQMIDNTTPNPELPQEFDPSLSQSTPNNTNITYSSPTVYPKHTHPSPKKDISHHVSVTPTLPYTPVNQGYPLPTHQTQQHYPPIPLDFRSPRENTPHTQHPTHARRVTPHTHHPVLSPRTTIHSSQHHHHTPAHQLPQQD